jgi:hypothetical protein
MNLGQMLLVLLAIVLFSTLILGIYNAMSNQVEMAARNVFYTQGLYYADLVFQRIESQLLHDQTDFDFDGLITNIQTYEIEDMVIGDARYGMTLTASYCTPFGVIAAGPTDHIRVFARIHINYGAMDYFIGEDNPTNPFHDDQFSKVFARFGVAP